VNGEDSPEFKARVLEWLRQEQGIGAAQVESVRGGSSSEEIAQGVYAEVFGVDITYLMPGGEERVMNAYAGDVASLWRWVTGGPDA
jgi:hypothetical protein